MRIHMTKIAVFIVAVMVAATCAASVQAQTAQPTVGMVDVQRAFDEYKVTKSSNDEVNKLYEQFALELRIRDSHRLLTDQEIEELVRLRGVSGPDDAQVKRIDELEKLSKSRDEELNALSNTKELSEEQNARLRSLRDMQNKSEVVIRNLDEDYKQQVEKRKNELSDKITEDLKSAIEAVAKEKGLATVVDKIAVLYGGVDITNEVISRLNQG